MDLVTQSLLSSFNSEESLEIGLDDPVLFEHFVNYCAVSNEYGDELDVEDLHTGGGDDLGIDGIAIIVNGTLVSDSDEVDDLALLANMESQGIYAPYDGGADLFLPSKEAVGMARKQFTAWLSKRDDGL